MPVRVPDWCRLATVTGLVSLLVACGTPTANNGHTEIEPVSVYAVSQDDLSLTWVDGEDNHDIDSELWQLILTVLPEAQLQNRVREFEIFTDGADETIAYVSRLDTVDDNWLFALDYIDAEDIDEGEWVTTLLHEFAHIISLGAGQLDTTAESCPARYEFEEGCAQDGSWLRAWIDAFWPDARLQAHTRIVGDSESNPDGLADFYAAHESNFVNEYAASNPVEDFAESFAYFMLMNAPDAVTTERERKLKFFYDHDRLVSLRETVRSRTRVRRLDLDSPPVELDS